MKIEEVLKQYIYHFLLLIHINKNATIYVPAKKLKAYKKALKGKIPSTVKIVAIK